MSFAFNFNLKVEKPPDVKKSVNIFCWCYNVLFSEPDIPDKWYDVCKEPDVYSDILH